MLENLIEEKCCGCGACYNICPKNAITMKENNEGFQYPFIDKSKCINCGICEKTCPNLNRLKNENKIPSSAIAAYTKNEEERKNSSSGGVFSELARYILNQEGFVIGSKFDKDFNVIHKMVRNKEELKELQGSKYVQSDIGDTYKIAKKNLDENNYLLFVGTPCQIAGLKSYLKKDYDKLYTCELICHGVPSPKIWRKYLEGKDKKNIEDVYFRNKDSGWNKFSIKIVYKNKKCKRKNLDKDKFMQLFLKNYSLRPSCYYCEFSKLPRVADISLGDFWGVENKYKEFMDDQGTSLILINNNKGKQLFNKIKENIYYKENCDLEYAIRNNPCICNSVEMPEKRKEFFENLDKMEFNELSKKYLPRENILKKVFVKSMNYLSIIKRKIIK